jgi:single-strand DNA-binding protein
MSRSKKQISAEEPDESDEEGLNLVVLRGRISSAPTLRALPSGDEVLNFELVTPTGLGKLSVPVVSDPLTLDLDAGREVVIVGHVRRRFFRLGSGVQSRTEVVAESTVLASQGSKVRKVVDEAVEYLGVG